MWRLEDLNSAMEAVQSARIGVNEAARQFKVPCTTLRRKLKSGGTKTNRLGPPAVLGDENEKKIVAHIIKTQNRGFAPTRSMARSMAYHLAEQLKIKHSFNKENEKAGFDWLKSFLRRNPHLSVRKSEGVSLARVRGMNEKDISDYFKLLGNILEEHDLFSKPGHLYNMDETGLQLNNKTEYVIARKGSKNVAAVTSGEKGETITVISCCNAEENWNWWNGIIGKESPVVCGLGVAESFEKPQKQSCETVPEGDSEGIVNKSQSTSDHVTATTSKEASGKRKRVTGNNISTENVSAVKQEKLTLQVEYLKLKNYRTKLEILKLEQELKLPASEFTATLPQYNYETENDSSVEVLEYAEMNDVILLCLPSHTTQFLQPLDRAFFKALKSHYNAACNSFLRTNPTRSTGIFPFNPDSIPDYAFLGKSGVTTGSANTEIDVFESYTDTNVNQSNTAVQPADKDAPTTNKKKHLEKSWTSFLPSLAHLRKKAETLAKKERKVQQVQTNAKKINRDRRNSDISSDSDISVILENDSSSGTECENECVGCGEDYKKTVSREDWLQCVGCHRWLHEGCTSFTNHCLRCGRKYSL
nr:unnamed protein product [Callosobruchus analis]